MSNAKDLSGATPDVCLLCDASKGPTLQFQKNHYRIYRCKECTGLFVYPQPSERELKAIYDESYFHRGNKYTSQGKNCTLYPNCYNDFQKIKLIREYKLSGCLLDVGCAMGGFLKIAKENGYEVVGVEISEFAATYARQHFGLEVINCDLPSAKFVSQSFDIITLWDVLEHIRNPHSLLIEVSRILHPDGILVLSTGDASSLWAQITGRFWHLFTPPQHVFFYTPKSLCQILGRHQFQSHEIFYLGKKATLDFISFKASETLGLIITPIRALISALKLKDLQVCLNLRDILTLVAKKSFSSS